MNYPTFLKAVDALLDKSDKDKLAAFVHEEARTLSEDKRDEFLDKLESFIAPTRKFSSKNADDSLSSEIDEILERLEQIQNEERVVKCSYNEEWDDWYDEFDDEYCFSDPYDVVEDISDAVSLLHESIDKEEYMKGSALALKLSELSIKVTGDYNEPYMSVIDLISHDLLTTDKYTLLSEAICVTYRACIDENPAEAIMNVMDSFGDYLPLEDILKESEVEIDLPSFLPLWIEAIASRETSYGKDELLLEAISMLDDGEYAISIASRYALSHPIIYLAIMSHGLMNVPDSKMLEVGLKGLSEVPRDFRERAELALLTAGYAVATNDRSTAEKCWFEAFKAYPSVVNYLRLRLLSNDWKKYSAKMKTIYTAYYSPKSDWEKDSLYVMRFFDGQFEATLDFFVAEESYRSNGISFFLLLLSDNLEGFGMNSMIRQCTSIAAFNAERYFMGTGMSDKESDAKCFEKCFESWKADITINPDTRSKWISTIDKWIRSYVSRIVGNTERSSYSACAAYIAAFGEMLESLGNYGAKQTLLQEYKLQYPRHRAFISELVQYGLEK